MSQIADSGPIPGLQKALTKEDLERACEIHHSLQVDNDAEGRQKHINSLFGLLKKYKAENVFRIIDVHKHFLPQRGSHMVAKLTNTEAQSIRISTHPVQDKAFKPSELCGYKFALIRKQKLELFPYEFRVGPLLNESEMHSNAISMFINYSNEHGITTLGLEYSMPQTLGKTMYEIVSLEQKSMLLAEITLASKLSNELEWVATAWGCSSTSTGVPEPQQYCGKDKNTGKHK